MARTVRRVSAEELLDLLGFTPIEDTSCAEVVGGATRSATPPGTAGGAAYGAGPVGLDSPAGSAGPSNDEEDTR